MADDKPKKDDEKAPATDEKGELLHPDGMNPHIVPEKEKSEEEEEKD